MPPVYGCAEALANTAARESVARRLLRVTRLLRNITPQAWGPMGLWSWPHNSQWGAAPEAAQQTLLSHRVRQKFCGLRYDTRPHPCVRLGMQGLFFFSSEPAYGSGLPCGI